MPANELSIVAQSLKKRARQLHFFDFAFEGVAGVVGIRVPTFQEEQEARLQAIRDIAKALGGDLEVLEDEIYVDQSTLNLLSHACRDPKDPDGIPLFGPPAHMARTLRKHELAKLLEFLEEARARESGERDDFGDEDFAMVRDILETCEREQAVEHLSGMTRSSLVGLAWRLARD